MAFSFGSNWLRYSTLLDEDRLIEAEKSLQQLLERDTLDGLSFLDLGSGSGLFSIAAARLGAKKVVAIDKDENCLLATRRNAERFLGPLLNGSFEISKGDILAPETGWLSKFDIVYAWGSLHHTGALWCAIENAAQSCAVGGYLVLAIYNRTLLSPVWLRIKRLYHIVPSWVRFSMVATFWAIRGVCRMVRGKHPFRAERGMSVWYDAVDWLGGLPYEYAAADHVVGFLTERTFQPVRAVLTRRSGCNEFVFIKGN